jgi:hypothetical protein
MTLTWGAILGVIAVLSTVAAQATIRRHGFLITVQSVCVCRLLIWVARLGGCPQPETCIR